MATPKQTRAVYKKIRFHLYHLRCALNQAHQMEVISYPNTEFREKAPCASLEELSNRIRLTTEKALALSMREEIMKELKNVW